MTLVVGLKFSDSLETTVSSSESTKGAASEPASSASSNVDIVVIAVGLLRQSFESDTADGYKYVSLRSCVFCFKRKEAGRV